MAEEETDPLAGIKETTERVVRLCYLRPLLKGSNVEPFQMTEEEIDNMLEPYQRSISADLDVIGECLAAAMSIGGNREQSAPVTEEIVLKGNKDDS